MPAGDGRVGVCGVGVDITNTPGRMRSETGSRLRSTRLPNRWCHRPQGADHVREPCLRAGDRYKRGEVIGKNPRLLKSGLQTPWFLRRDVGRADERLPWAADFVNRRKDGTLFTEEGSISPIRDSSGAISSFVAVKRDVTQERALANVRPSWHGSARSSRKPFGASEPEIAGGNGAGDLPSNQQPGRRHRRPHIPLRTRRKRCADRLCRRGPG